MILTTSKTKQVCETSFKNGKLSAELTASSQCALHFFHSTCLKYCACHEKARPGHTKCCTCMSLVLRLPREMHLCRPSANLPRLPSFLEMLKNPHALLSFGKVQNPLRLPRKTTSEPSKTVRTWCVLYIDLEMCFAPPPQRALFRHQLPKVVRRWRVLYILTWKCVSRHNDVHIQNGDIPIQNGDFPIKIGDIPIKNGDFPIKHGDILMRNCDFPYLSGFKPSIFHGNSPSQRKRPESWRPTRGSL